MYTQPRVYTATTLLYYARYSAIIAMGPKGTGDEHADSAPTLGQLTVTVADPSEELGLETCENYTLSVRPAAATSTDDHAGAEFSMFDPHKIAFWRGKRQRNGLTMVRWCGRLQLKG
jgi:hypothetical protein